MAKEKTHLQLKILEAPPTKKSEEILQASAGRRVYVVEAGITKSVPTVTRYLSTGVTNAGNVRVLLYGRPQILHKQLGRKFYFDLEEMRIAVEKEVGEAMLSAQRRAKEMEELFYGWKEFEVHARPFIEPDYPKKLKLK